MLVADAGHATRGIRAIAIYAARATYAPPLRPVPRAHEDAGAASATVRVIRAAAHAILLLFYARAPKKMFMSSSPKTPARAAKERAAATICCRRAMAHTRGVAPLARKYYALMMIARCAKVIKMNTHAI